LGEKHIMCSKAATSKGCRY